MRHTGYIRDLRKELAARTHLPQGPVWKRLEDEAPRRPVEGTHLLTLERQPEPQAWSDPYLRWLGALWGWGRSTAFASSSVRQPQEPQPHFFLNCSVFLFSHPGECYVCILILPCSRATMSLKGFFYMQLVPRF